MRPLGALSLFIAFATPAVAQGFREKDVAYVRIPVSLLVWKGSLFGAPRREGQIDSAGRVNGEQNWKESGFPSWTALTIDRIKVDKKKGTGEVTLLDAKSQNEVKLKFDHWDDAILSTYLVAPSELAAAKDEVHAFFRGKYFVGKLAQVPDSTKDVLIDFVANVGNGSGISTEVFKDRTYLVVNLPNLGVGYNDAKLSTGQRTATVLNETALGALKAFAKAVTGAPEVEGVKLNLTVQHKNFVTVGADYQADKLELYSPVGLIRKFAAQDATGQELIDGSFVVLNGNRIKVDLTQS